MIYVWRCRHLLHVIDRMAPPFWQSHCQQHFQEFLGHLRNPHVRSLAWLLDAPDLFDHYAPCWEGRIARLGDAVAETDHDLLLSLERDPSPLLKALALSPHTRLGRYAESLMAFYLQTQGVLEKHGLQIRDDNKRTIGEFDFLVRIREEIVHWEFATKFYLLEPGGNGRDADYFIGPNLADTLGAKMNKIFERQLLLSAHPAAQRMLQIPVSRAQAFVKGWLFYRRHASVPVMLEGLSAAHCRGYWCTHSEWREEFSGDATPDRRYVVLTRLQWLAPARMPKEEMFSGAGLQQQLDAHFAHDDMPLLVAVMAMDGQHAYEIERGFVVRDDWQERASRRLGLAR